MSRPGYTLLGWIVWQIGRRVARRKLATTRVKLGLAAAVSIALAAAIAAARPSTSSQGAAPGCRWY